MTCVPVKCVWRTASARATAKSASSFTGVGQSHEPASAVPLRALAPNRPLSQLMPKIFFDMSKAIARRCHEKPDGGARQPAPSITLIVTTAYSVKNIEEPRQLY